MYVDVQKQINFDSPNKWLVEARITNCEGRIREIKAAKEEADEASKREGATLGARQVIGILLEVTI